MWTDEEIRFLKEYYKSYPLKEIALEINRTIKEVKDKILEISLMSIDDRLCKDCMEIKHKSEFYKRKKDGAYNCYCKSCDNIRRRNHTILKKIKDKLELDLKKKADSEQIKYSIKDILFECTSCKKKKIGSDFYFDSIRVKRYNRCRECERRYQEEQEIKKIMERGFTRYENT